MGNAEPCSPVNEMSVLSFQDVPSEAASTVKATKPEKDWPEKGEVKFSKYKMRYRKNLPLALKGIGFTIKAREKVGIVGRSGSGEFFY